VRAALLLLMAGVLARPTPATGQEGAAAAVGQLLVTARLSQGRWPDFARYVDDVASVYEARAGEPLWLDGPALTRQGHSAIAVLLRAADHGLDPANYDAAALDSVARYSVRSLLGMTERAGLDLSLTVNLMRFLDDLESGRLHLRVGDARSDTRLDRATAIRDGVAGDSIAGLAAAVTPQLAQYRNLQQQLARYRHLAQDSGLELLPGFVPSRKGDSYPGIGALRRRLVAVGDLAPDAVSAGVTLNGPDERALRKFQVRHGLEPTGVLDSVTFKEINTPFKQRVFQIELALERLRWLPHIGRQRFIVVNIPAFRLFAFDSAGGTGAPALSMRVIVGRALDKQTPVLYEQMRYLDFRPYWNVPRSILVEEIIPALRRDSAYLRRNNMELVGPADLSVEVPLTGDIWERLRTGELRVRQRPGPGNALGLLKFVFPNTASVYMHGTPQPELFAQARRDFSHGCIRLEYPGALAAWVLRDRREWSRDRIEAAQKAVTSSRALLSRPIPVIIFYTTAVASPGGELWFYTDIYGHDRSLAEALTAGPPLP
jgi:murein L,D-transpeptidase YcbB/YkuD